MAGEYAASRSRGLSHAGERVRMGEAPAPLCIVASSDDVLHRTVNDAVRALGCTATFVRTGRDLVCGARSVSCGVVLLDQGLPDVAGLDVARTLRRDTPDLPFVLVGSALTTPVIVEAMRLGALTVLEKPVARDDVVRTMRALAEARTAAGISGSTARIESGIHRSAAERWARYVLRGCEACGDLRTIGAWASAAGLSYSSLCEACRLVGVRPIAARNLTRVLRAVLLARRYSCRVEELLDISDRRTLKRLIARAGLDRAGGADVLSVEQFIAAQRFMPSEHAGLAIVRAQLLKGVAESQGVGVTRRHSPAVTL